MNSFETVLKWHLTGLGFEVILILIINLMKHSIPSIINILANLISLCCLFIITFWVEYFPTVQVKSRRIELVASHKTWTHILYPGTLPFRDNVLLNLAIETSGHKSTVTPTP